MKLQNILTSESAINILKLGIQGIALSFGVDGLMVAGLAEGAAAALKDWKEARNLHTLEATEAAAEAAAENIARAAHANYQRLPVAEQVALMGSIAQVDDSQQLLDAPQIQAVLTEIANPNARALAEGWVRALPDHVRRTLSRQEDPSGRTATSQNIPRSAADLGAAFAAIPSVYQVGQDVPHMPGWKLEAQIGGGGFGEVWRARKRELLCAVKFCKGHSSVANLQIERDLVERVSQLAKRTPGLVQVEDDFLDQVPPSLVYEYIHGCTLDAHIKARAHDQQPFAWREAAGIILELGETMAVCHGMADPIIHRDLKPANILLDLRDPSEPRLRITDFGIGAAMDAATGLAMRGYTQSMQSHSAKYASPEQLLGTEKPHPRDDIHALGIIWLQLLCSDLNEDQLDGPTRRGLLSEGHPEALLHLLEECIATKRAYRPEIATVLVQRLRSLLLASPSASPQREVVPSFSSPTLSQPLSPPPLPGSGGLKPGTTPPASLPQTAAARPLTVEGMSKGEFEKLPAYAASLEGQGRVKAATFAFAPRSYNPERRLCHLIDGG